MSHFLFILQDKVKINSLSMVAEDHADSPKSAAALYDCIRTPLTSPNVSKERKLPLVYVLDSILKNVKGEYIRIVERDAKTWMPLVYNALPEDQGKKLLRVWNMWRDAKLFSEENWKEMGECFSAPAIQGDGARQDRAVRSITLTTRVSLVRRLVISCSHSLLLLLLLYYIIGGWYVETSDEATERNASNLGRCTKQRDE
jgi:hypothetical protein